MPRAELPRGAAECIPTIIFDRDLDRPTSPRFRREQLMGHGPLPTRDGTLLRLSGHAVMPWLLRGILCALVPLQLLPIHAATGCHPGLQSALPIPLAPAHL